MLFSGLRQMGYDRSEPVGMTKKFDAIGLRHIWLLRKQRLHTVEIRGQCAVTCTTFPPFMRPAEFAQDDTTDLPVFLRAES